MRTITVDLHTHLIEKRELPERYWKAVGRKKIDAVAITEHADKKPWKAYEMLLESKPKNAVLVPGMELNTSIGHVLAYGRDEGIYSLGALYDKGMPIEKLVSIAEKEKLLLSISHPWGLSYDSAAYILGEKKLQSLVGEGKLGVEVYNGMFGNVSGFFYRSNWIRKPFNFFDFLEKSRIARKTRLSVLGKKVKQKLDKKSRELIERCAKPITLGQSAAFITAGSDAHSATRVGSAVMKIRVSGRLNCAKVLDALQKKANVAWAGPYVRETESGYVTEGSRLEKKEILQGIQYAAKRAIVKRMRIRKGR